MGGLAVREEDMAGLGCAVGPCGRGLCRFPAGLFWASSYRLVPQVTGA